MLLTDLVKHLVAFVKNEHTHAAEAQVLVAHKSIKPAWGTDNNVWVRLLVFEDLGILLDRSTAVENTRLDVRHVLAEAVILVPNLESELTSVAHHQHGAFASDRLNLLECRQNEDGSFAETGLGLADDITTKHSLGNTCLLNCIRRRY